MSDSVLFFPIKIYVHQFHQNNLQNKIENLHETLLALVLAAAILFFWKRNSSKNLPPGPKPRLIIGNMDLLGSSPHRSLHSLSHKYGEIMLIRFGKFPVVVASSPLMAEQFLKVHDVNFASRPMLAAGKYTGYNYSNVIWSPYGPHWRQARKICHSEVFCAKRLEFFEPIRVDEGRSFLSRLHSLSGKPVVLRKLLSHYTLSSMSGMVLGNKYFSKTGDGGKRSSIFKIEEMQDMVDEWFLLNGGVFNVGDWIPWLRSLDLQGYVKRMNDLAKEFDRFLEFVIDVHQARRDSEGEDFEPRDVVDMLLGLAENPNLEVKLTRVTIKALLQDLLTGSTDTSAVSIEWAILEVLRHPRVAGKAREELDRVIGRNKWVEEKDMPQLPYINAIVKESWRMHPLGSLIAPHYVIEDCKVKGYDIPKGTTVIINAWSLGRDPNSWDAPEEFIPERFLGEGNVDANGNHFALLPFGSGRRRCPGYKLGTMIVGTTLANLLHGFEMRPADVLRPQDVSVEELYGLVKRPKESVKLIMEPTLPPSLYRLLSKD